MEIKQRVSLNKAKGDFNYMYEIQQRMINEFIEKLDKLIEQRLSENGFNVDDKRFLKDNFTFIELPTDDFRHLYYHFGQPDQKRIISIEKETCVPVDNLGSFTFTATKKYY